MSEQKQIKVYFGGLMRCCIATIEEMDFQELSDLSTERSVLSCKYCKSTMIFKVDHWRWNSQFQEKSNG